MKVYKWDDSLKQYETVRIPDGWKILTYAYDMDEMCNCVNCGKEMPYGFSHTSRRYHTESGFGYAECVDCYFAYNE